MQSKMQQQDAYRKAYESRLHEKAPQQGSEHHIVNLNDFPERHLVEGQQRFFWEDPGFAKEHSVELSQFRDLRCHVVEKTKDITRCMMWAKAGHHEPPHTHKCAIEWHVIAGRIHVKNTRNGEMANLTLGGWIMIPADVPHEVTTEADTMFWCTYYGEPDFHKLESQGH